MSRSTGKDCQDLANAINTQGSLNLSKVFGSVANRILVLFCQVRMPVVLAQSQTLLVSLYDEAFPSNHFSFLQHGVDGSKEL
jgi:hypothetical protein